MTKLSVNINKIATLRNARGGNNPDLIKAAIDCERFGAQGITVHPRPDERHIRRSDVFELHKVVTTEFNIEGYPSEDFLQLIEKVKPAQVTLVPDPPGVLTSNAGWDTVKHHTFLKDVIGRLKEIDLVKQSKKQELLTLEKGEKQRSSPFSSVRISLFIEPDVAMIEKAKTTGADRIELYTEDYAAKYFSDREEAIAPYIIAATAANAIGLGINAGHDLSLENLKYFIHRIPNVLEVSIGHAIICDALYYGLENTIQMYRRELRIQQ